VSAHELHFVVPGPLEQRTGGYLYDARMVHGLRARGWHVRVHNLDGAFPHGDATARRSLEEALAGLDDGALVVVDGLAMGGLPDPICAHGARLRIVSLVHHPLADETGLSEADRRTFTESEREALAPCRGVIVTSTYTAHRLRDYGTGPDRCRAVPPGTEPAALADGPPPGSPPVLLCVATVTPRKGHDVLVTALARVRDLPWRCVCAGSLDRDPAFAADVLGHVQREGLADRIHFVGEHGSDALDALYQESSVFVLASHYEGYGMALAEALARGLPIVSTTGGAIPYTVPADAGVLVPPADPVAFADALRAVLDPDAPSTRERLAAAARTHAGSLPGWPASVHRFEEALLEFADRHGGGPDALDPGAAT
jgi:glycosyltransferase involved in cell wall biosynthesis